MSNSAEPTKPPIPPARGPSSTSIRPSTRPRRHSLPASTAELPTLALLHRGNADDTTASVVPSADLVTEEPIYNPPVKPRKSGHKSSKSSLPALDQPVLVRSYSPRPQSSLGMVADEVHTPVFFAIELTSRMWAKVIYKLEDEVPVELPPIDAFTFSGILKAVEPKGAIFSIAV